MKRLSLLSTINKLNKFGISPIYQYGLNSTTLRNSIITIQKRSYTSLSSTPPSAPSPSPSAPSPSEPSPSALSPSEPSPSALSPSPPAPSRPNSENKQSELLKEAISSEKEKRKLIVNKIIQSKKTIVESNELTSTLLSELITYDKSLALKLFDRYHSDLIDSNKKKENFGKKIKERTEEEIQMYFYNNYLGPFETILKYCASKRDVDGLEAFCLNYISEYEFYIFSTPFFAISKKCWRIKFEKFNEFVFRICDDKSLSSPNLITRAMVSILKLEKRGGCHMPLDKLLNTHIERWGPITSKDGAFKILRHLILTKDVNAITKVLNNINLKITDNSVLKPQAIVSFSLLFNFQKYGILVKYQDLLFNEMKKLLPNEVAALIFFFNVLTHNIDYEGEFRIKKRALSRLNNEFLKTLPKETTKIIIDQLVKYFLSINHYEKSLYWFSANSTMFENKISKVSTFNFIAHHTLQLEKLNKKIEDLTRQTTTTTTTTEIIREIEEEKGNETLEKLQINIKKYEESRQLWRKTLKLSENQTYDDKYLSIERDVYSEFIKIKPSEILESINHLPDGFEGIIAKKVDYKF
ncbi:hypothetical protein ACTFIY_009943 [Dictyostelium cf. discoideum]